MKRVAIKVVIAFAFGLGFSLLIEVGIPLVLEATGAKRLVPPQPPPDPPAFLHFNPPKVPAFLPRSLECFAEQDDVLLLHNPKP